MDSHEVVDRIAHEFMHVPDAIVPILIDRDQLRQRPAEKHDISASGLGE